MAPWQLPPHRKKSLSGVITCHIRAKQANFDDQRGDGKAGPDGPGGAHGYFLNAFSLGVYPELVRTRERWA
ncbi:hypothetical protein ABT025_32990, partial [Streptomyces sp. NPDC002809]